MERSCAAVLIGIFCIIGPTQAQTWSAVGDGPYGYVNAMAVFNGELHVAGQGLLSSPNSVGIVKWNGSTYDPLPGTEMFGTHRIDAMIIYNGELIVGGTFEEASGPFGSISNNIARWNGTTWSTMGAGFDNVVYALKDYNGQLFASGGFQNSGLVSCALVAKWNGSEWSGLNNNVLGTLSISAMAKFEGELYFAGNFWDTGISTYCVARWDGNTWNNLGGNGVGVGLYALCEFQGAVVVGGVPYEMASGVPVDGMGSWNGTQWNSLNAGPDAFVLSMISYHGELYTGGDFQEMGGTSAKSIARFDGSAWNSVGSGVDSTGIIVDTMSIGLDTIYFQAPHRVLCYLEYNGDLYIGGHFNMIGGIEAHSLASWNMPLSIGNEEPSSSSPVQLVPNPASDQVHITMADGSPMLNVRVIDSRGRTVLEVGGTSDRSIDVSHLADGVYQVQLFTSSGSYAARLVVRH